MPEHKNLAEALAAAQADLTNVGLDGTGNYGKYATLPALINGVRPILATHGLSWSALPSISESGAPSMQYQLLHAVEGCLKGEMALLMTKQDAQAQGSALTYARRYALSAVLNIGAEEDDDGQHATDTQRRAPAEPPVADTALLKAAKEACYWLAGETADAAAELYGAVVQKSGGALTESAGHALVLAAAARTPAAA